jgi:hypothetical protein
MDLASLQRQLLRLIKSTYRISEDDDPYIYTVAKSPQLELVREIISQWRFYDIERTCSLTSALLKRLKLFDEAVRTFIGERRLSPFVEELGAAFLEEMTKHDAPLVAAVARFELALIKVKRGDPNDYVVDWDRDPYAVLHSLLDDVSMDESKSPNGFYRTVISYKFQDFFIVQQLIDAKKA